jgi:predicted MPP superfamily phosphohydrolase
MNDEPPVNPRNLLHHALVSLHVLTRIPSALFGLLFLALAIAVGRTWYTHTAQAWPAAVAGGGYLLFIVLDWVWLAALPRWNVSFGPVKPPLAGLGLVRLLIATAPLAAHPALLSAAGCALASALLHLLACGAIVYATRMEPFRLGVTHLELTTTKLDPGQRVRLVQLSDLHVERITRREREVVKRVNALQPDYVLLTGDYLNFSFIGEPQAIADARQVLGQLQARTGIYAVRGTHQVDPNALLPVLFDGLPIRWLRSEHITVSRNGYRVTFAGASCSRRRDIDLPAVERALDGVPQDAFTVLLYHTPDLASEASAMGVDLYLSGHTHGGQIRLPLYGALITGTDIGKRYEMGQYDVKGLTLYVSRGLGMEGMAAPRARFLCPPEIVCIDVRGVAET